MKHVHISSLGGGGGSEFSRSLLLYLTAITDVICIETGFQYLKISAQGQIIRIIHTYFCSMEQSNE